MQRTRRRGTTGCSAPPVFLPAVPIQDRYELVSRREGHRAPVVDCFLPYGAAPRADPPRHRPRGVRTAWRPFCLTRSEAFLTRGPLTGLLPSLAAYAAAST